MIKTQHPYIDEEGKSFDNLIKTYSDVGLNLIQVETSIEYSDEVIDEYPCKYTYIEKPNDPTDLEESEEIETEKD